MRRWYRSMIDFCKIFLPCLCFFLQIFFIFSFYLLFSISVSCFLFFYFLCCLSLIYYKPPMQFFLGSCCQHLIFSIRIGSVKKKKTNQNKSAWRGRAAILWALCTSGCFFHLVVSRTPRGQWQERDFQCKLLDLLISVTLGPGFLTPGWWMNLPFTIT